MKQLSIRRYVAWLTLIPLLIMTVSLETYFLHDRFVELDTSLMDRGKLIARQLASGSEYGVFSNNIDFLQNIAQGVLQQQDVKGVIVLGTASTILADAGEFSSMVESSSADVRQSNPEQTNRIDPSQVKEITSLVDLQHPVIQVKDALWIFQPIIPVQVTLDDTSEKAAPQQVGAVIIEMSMARTHKLKSNLLWVTVGATGWFLIFSFYLVYLASRRITKPICQLNDAIKLIGEGNLQMCVSIPTRILELKNLTQGINAMAAQLQQENVLLHQRAEEATRLAAIAFESHEGMMIADGNGRILKVNSAFSKITGYEDIDIVGHAPSMLKSGRHDFHFYTEMWESIKSTGLWQGEIFNRHKNGGLYPAWLTITEIKNETGEVAYFVATYTDITLRKAAENEIKNLAYFDVLTQLPNRRLLIDRLNQTMAASKRSGLYGALMFIDLDNFKPLNDQYGHTVGDLLLIEVASRLVSCIREIDTVARFGGDEFVVMLQELNSDKAESIAQANVIAEKIRTTLAESYELEIKQGDLVDCKVRHRCTSSIGVAMFTNHDAGPDEIIKYADLAMYKAKRDGRNLIRFY